MVVALPSRQPSITNKNSLCWSCVLQKPAEGRKGKYFMFFIPFVLLVVSSVLCSTLPEEFCSATNRSQTESLSEF